MVNEVKMKRTDLIRHLEAHGCALWRGGGKAYDLPQPGQRRVLRYPTTSFIKKFLAYKICDDLDVPRP
jgi:hypothetical protein